MSEGKDFRERAREIAESGLEKLSAIIESEKSSAESVISATKLAAGFAGVDQAALPSERLLTGGLTIVIPHYDPLPQRTTENDEVTFATTEERPLGTVEQDGEAVGEVPPGERSAGAEAGSSDAEVHEKVEREVDGGD